MTAAANTFATIGSAQPPTGPPARIGTAVVLGASIAGLLAARVRAEHAEAVIVIERDAEPPAGAPRYGVPQGSQVHALLPGGGRQLERWFPGFTDAAVERGALRATHDRRRQWVEGVAKVTGSRVDLLCATRPFLEGEIRRWVRSLPNVTVVAGRAAGLEFNDTAVTVVRYEVDGAAVRQPADFVVDAMGRASKLGDWLTAGGWDAPVWLTGQIIGASVTNPVVSRLFDEVTFMLRHPSDLARANVLMRALLTQLPITRSR